jgi:signal transduction histidine kinase
LFLAAGVVLLSVTYGLVAASLPDARAVPALSAADSRLLAECKAVHASADQAAKAEGAPASPPTSLDCKKVFAAGAAAGTTDSRARTLDNLLTYSLVGLGLATLFSAILGWFMAGRALRPVRRITEAARRAAERDFGERVSLGRARDEVGELAATFDDMLGRLGEAFANQERFIADASHELRTPLSAMRTALEVAMAKPAPTTEQWRTAAASLGTSIAKAQGLVEALLILARSNRVPEPREPLDLATVVENALDDLGPAARAAGVGLSATICPAPVVGNEVLLERAVANLVDNAISHNLAGGWARVETGTEDGRAVVRVANSGPVVPSDVEAPFVPFRRGEARTRATDGHGLGLAIVRAVVAAHSGTVTARPLPEGGLEVVVSLPGASAPGQSGEAGEGLGRAGLVVRRIDPDREAVEAHGDEGAVAVGPKRGRHRHGASQAGVV